MTELQNLSFEMLKAFIKVCEELNLRYYLVCGSALGAVKYGGFIPWDDDIDVGLPRADYEIFCEKAQELLPKHIFLQNYRSDPEFPSIISRLRNSNTTYVVKLYQERNINHGVFMDVMPLDVYPHENTKEFEKQKMEYARKRAAYLYQPFNIKAVRSNLVKFSKRLTGCKDISKTMREYDNFLSDPSYKSDIWCNHGNWQGVKEYAPISQYGDGVMMKFEGLDVRVPENYDEYLTQKYGDWRADLPEEEKEGHHYYKILDLDRPYTDYIKTVSKDKRRIKLRKVPENDK